MTTAHLDDEALSAAFDGEASPVEQAHLDGCARCQAGVAKFAEVVRAVGSPVPARPTGEVEAAISRALATAGEPAAALAAETATVTSAASTSEWRPLPGGCVQEPVAARAGRPRRPSALRGRWLGVAGGIAAAVAAVVGLAALLHATGGHQAATTSAAAPTTIASRNQPQVAAGAAGATTSGTDLGDQSDPAALARDIRARLGLPLSDFAAGPAAGPPPPSTTVPAPARGFSQPGPCLAQGPPAAGLAGSQLPVFVGNLRWQGQPAVVLVYSGPVGRVGVVMRSADCLRLAIVPL